MIYCIVFVIPISRRRPSPPRKGGNRFTLVVRTSTWFATEDIMLYTREKY